MLLWAATFRPKPYKVQVTILGFLVALMLTSLLTDIIKNAVGRPRPDLISRCIPKRGTPENKLVAWTVCTQTSQHVLQEGWRSFPSGHSSFSFSGLGYLSLLVLTLKSASQHNKSLTGVLYQLPVRPNACISTKDRSLPLPCGSCAFSLRIDDCDFSSR